MRFVKFIKKHKVLSVLGALAIIGLVYYVFFRSGSGVSTPQYVYGKVTKGTIAVSVTGSGQVEVLNQIDVKPKVSGEITYVGASQGQWVAGGATILKLDTVDAEKAVRDAQVNLESAELAMEKLKASSADISVILENSFTDISDAFLDFPSIITSAQTIILGSTLSPGYQDNVGYYKNFVSAQDTANAAKDETLVYSASADYAAARAKYDAVFALYKTVTRDSDQPAIQNLLTKTYDAAKAIGQALKSEQNLIDFLIDYGTDQNRTIPPLFTTYKATLKTNTGLVNGHLSALSADDNSVANAPRDLRSQELSVQQRRNALLDAKQALEDYYVRAPLSGVVAKFDLKAGDSVSPSTAVATIITTARTAELSLNEVDVAKVKIGQKASLTFDALPDLEIAGIVTKMDTLGTVSQGVVTYGVTIGLNTQDARVKPGMSVSASIITDTKADVLMVPNSAVKLAGSIQYVETQPASGTIPTAVKVTTGIANDADTEIISGLSEGDRIVVRSITSAISAAAPAPSLFGGGSIRTSGGGNNTFRAQVR